MIVQKLQKHWEQRFLRICNEFYDKLSISLLSNSNVIMKTYGN